MFKALALITALVLTTQAASAGTLADRARSITFTLQNVEFKLTNQDRLFILGSLQEIEGILNGTPTQPYKKLVCLSNGSTGSFEKFAPHDLNTNQIVGGYTDKGVCQELVKRQNAGLMCVSNGSTGSFERFTPMDLQTFSKLGGETTLQSCHQIVARATYDLLCTSNGSTGSFERFTLYSRRTGQEIGGETSFNNCMESLP